MVEGAALEMLCGETHLGFESLTLRQKKEQMPFGICSFCLQFFKRDSKDERHRATVRWTVVTASDQTPAGVRVKSFCPCQKKRLPKGDRFNFSTREGLEGRAAQSNSPVDCCDRKRPSARRRASQVLLPLPFKSRNR